MDRQAKLLPIMADPSTAPLSGVSDTSGPRLNPHGLVEGHKGPALYLAQDGQILASNIASEPVVVLLGSADGHGLRHDIANSDKYRRTLCTRIRAQSEGESKTYDLTLLPCSDADGSETVLILGHDVTLDQNLTKALIASRELFKDLVSCSADFSWETDPSGAFSFVSPAGALGYSATALVGTSFQQLIHLESAERDNLPFTCRAPQNNIEIRLRDATGEPASVLASSVPVYSKSGEWLGARGVCRDITELRRREEVLQRAQQREVLLQQVVDAIRTEVNPEAMFEAAVRATSRVFGGARCSAVRIDSGDQLLLAASHCEVSANDIDVLTLLSEAQGDVGTSSEVMTLALSATSTFLTAACEYQEERLGYLCLDRIPTQDLWTDTDKALLARVADHLGIAMAQARIQERLRDLSRTDDLTGLLNRRAFEEELEIRLHNVNRLGRHGALFFLDLDNFKCVNDIHGHARGDEALQAFAGLLECSVRAGDLIARLGGDEFALWLEGAPANGARAKAGALLEAAQVLEQFSGDAARPLSVSIGVLSVAPEHEQSVSALLQQADELMYHAKRAGKGQAAFAEAKGRESPGAMIC